MNLTIDAGNTSTKLMVFENDYPLYRKAVTTLTPSLISKISRYFKVSHILLSTVINLDKKTLKSISEIKGFKVLTHRTALPLTITYKTPQTLGRDRIANAVGAHFLFPKRNVLVIDVGTCVKYDFVNVRGHYLGGSISPGLKMRYKALHEFTGKLPLIKPITKTGSLIGDSTESAIQTGVQTGMEKEITGFIDLYKNKYSNLQIILTGGDLSYFAGQLKLSIFAAPDLANIGLNEIIRFNEKK